MVRVVCPLCGRGERDCTLIIFDDGKVHCHRCGKNAWRAIKAALGDFPDHPPERAARPWRTRHDGLATWASERWASTLALSGEAEAYLTARVCVLPPADGDLRWHPEVLHKPTGHVGPALIAQVTDAISNKPISLHHTWIRRDGTKPVKPARMLAGGHRAKGGVIRLWPDNVATGLAVTEGSKPRFPSRMCTSPWSCIDAGNLAAFPCWTVSSV